MKVRTKFDRQVSAANARLAAISPKAADWAYDNLVKHWAFRTPSGMTTCGECGHSIALSCSFWNSDFVICWRLKLVQLCVAKLQPDSNLQKVYLA